ncbi:thiamine transport system permease protein [Mameliella alba]|uniref:thiamine/thiamine pyrophosphate ABC transporter permease ThiP n=1 Tax=Mameliella alba TaxID=561184 RepID=UPI00087E5304|nr:thiamine/thiamine pyrophosphate ABC transporter permease ThiP [Mameliella alba]OWV44082.1 thiamine/thiamine pyrophosphate ABC transporter permease ThiP [Mameliella alba]PTR36315.1 thiamine transport system permease protein [Mameliella alba]GGF79331.1 thiamine/thiamine pyrophosphate ABC transporter permease ThiP [Mameliella alba]SDD95440.1 thiamine transport system permease protein [Mameliella alba]
MAPRALAIAAALALAVLTLGPVGVVLARAGGFGAFGPGDWQALRFTLWQAFLSATFSVVLAVPVAKALARRRFAGRGVLVTLLGAPFILPVIVAVMGLIAVFGQAGLVNRLLGALGGPNLDIYGLHGVVLAHVFFNLPLAVRMLFSAWAAVPAEHFRLSASLGLSPRAQWRVIDAPLILRVLPGAFTVIFVICLTSFAVALTLGGGPRATTVELAIYQAMRFDFDLGRAAALAVMQLVLALAAGLVALRVAGQAGFGAGRDRILPRWDGQGGLARGWDGMWIVAAALFLLVPLAAVVLRGLPGLLLITPDTLRAAGHSLMVALGSTALCMAWALPLATRRGEFLALPAIAISPLVLGTGLFLILRNFVNPFDMALPVTGLVNALMALPFALRILRPEAEAVTRDYGRLRASLRMTSLAWLRLVWLPRLRRPMGFAAGLTAALAMGDLGVIALFADPDRATLPLQVYRLMGSYQMEAAAGAALLLLCTSLGLFWLFDRGGRLGAEA